MTNEDVVKLARIARQVATIVETIAQVYGDYNFSDDENDDFVAAIKDFVPKSVQTRKAIRGQL